VGVKTGVYLNHSAADRSGRRVRLALTAQMALPMASMVTGSPGRRAAAKRTARDEASKAGCHAADARRPIGIKIVPPDRIVLDRDAAKERGIDTHDGRPFGLCTTANRTDAEPTAVGTSRSAKSN
jgi:hypothetical protein